MQSAKAMSQRSFSWIFAATREREKERKREREKLRKREREKERQRETEKERKRERENMQSYAELAAHAMKI